MVEQQQEFGYRNIVLYKSQTLGTGSYGGVCKAKCDGLLCAAKIMHPTLFDLRDPGTTSYLRRFEEECRILSLARHPNIVQYLATYRDPETHLPVLLMELCDESLSRFLERSLGPLPYHTELNISHDIALALVYLHTNGLIHRDLTGNNVLLIAGVRAKVTDFGMSKLASVNPRMTPLTLCPGNMQYMSPEALEETPSYTEKLDIFSFGVLQIQMITKQFPNPGPRFQMVDLPGGSHFSQRSLRMVVPETQRRNTHLQLISNTHALKQVALNCLKDKERERPSAQQLSNILSELKQAPQYTESMQRAQVGDFQRHNQEQQREIEYLQKKKQEQQMETEHLQEQNQKKQEENERLHLQQQHYIAYTNELEQQLEKQRVLIEKMGRENQLLQSSVEKKERELQESEQLVEQFQLSMEQKDKKIEHLQQAISFHKKNFQQPQQQVSASSGQHQQLPVIAAISQGTTAAQKDITKLRWKEGNKAPEGMWRGAAVVSGNTIYINSHDSHKVYSCLTTSGELLWSALPNSAYVHFSLAVIDGLLTCVGGRGGWDETCYSALLSLTEKSSIQHWFEVFPPMPTARSQTASVTTEQLLIVAGGYNGRKHLNTVEVMTISTKVWTTAQSLPHPFSLISGTICGDQLYLGGGYVGFGKASKSVLTCSLTDLLPPQLFRTKLHAPSLATKPGTWQEIKELPVTRSTLTALSGYLLAIGGKSDSYSPTDDVHCYNCHTDSWEFVTKMKNKRYMSLSATLPEEQLLIVGGYNDESMTSLEIGSF